MTKRGNVQNKCLFLAKFPEKKVILMSRINPDIWIKIGAGCYKYNLYFKHHIKLNTGLDTENGELHVFFCGKGRPKENHGKGEKERKG